MTEPVKPTEPNEPTEPTPETPAPADPRETPAFKGLLKQHNELLAKFEQMQSAQDKAARAEEQKRLEEQGKYAEALALAEAEAAKAKSEAERAINKSKLALNGVHDPVHAEFLVSAYNNTDDKKDSFDEWIATAKEVDSYKPFFGLADPPARQGLPGGDASPGAARSTGGSYTRADLRSADPETRTAAIKWYQDYVNQKGEKPW